MEIYSQIAGNIKEPLWRERLKECEIEYLPLDQWTAQKSRFVACGDKGNEYAVALTRHLQVATGDILLYDPKEKRAVVIKVELKQVLVIEMNELLMQDKECIARTAVELGHAIGNQHWPAVVKGSRVYVPLTVDKKVMESVMETHHIEHICFSFHPGEEVIPYLAPHEVRRLFGGASQESHSHLHEDCDHRPHAHHHVV